MEIKRTLLVSEETTKSKHFIPAPGCKRGKKKSNIPPDHNPKPLNIPQIQRLHPTAIPILAPIRRPEITPLDENRLPPIRPEIKLPAQRALVAPIGPLGRNTVLQCEGVDLAICVVDDEFDAVVRGQIPVPVFTRRALGGEARAAEGGYV